MEVLLFYSSILMVLIITIGFGIFRFKHSKNIINSFLQSTILSLLLFIVLSWWWKASQTDGLSEGLGIMYYSIAFGGIIFINFIVLYVIRSKHNSSISKAK